MATIFCTAPVFIRAALIFMLLGLATFVVGFATVSWMTGEGTYSRLSKLQADSYRYRKNNYNAWQGTRYRLEFAKGLWEYEQCIWRRNVAGVYCETATYSHIQLSDYHRAIRAMECLGLLCMVLGLISLLLYFCLETARRRDFLMAATAFVFVGVAFSGVGFALFGSSHEKNNQMGHGLEIGWSLCVAMAGSGINTIAGIMLLLHLCGCRC